MTEQVSRLSIVVDLKNADKQTERLRNLLSGLENVSEKVSDSQKKICTSTEKTNKAFAKQSKSAKALDATFRKLKGTILGVVGAMGVSYFIGIADKIQNLNSQVKLVTKSTAEYNAVQAQLHKIANKQYASLAAVTGLYADSRRALEQLGKSQQQTLDFTNNLSMAMRIGGSDTVAQAAALRQLGQALASGVLRGDEFNSIAEQAPILLRLMSDELGVAQGKLRGLAAEGKLTSEIVYNAIANATEKLEGMAEKMPVTVGQALTTLKNNFDKYVGNFLNNTLQATGMIAKVISYVAENMDTLIKTTIAGGALAFLSLAASIDIAAIAAKAFSIVLATNPLLLIAGAILAIVAATGDLGDMLSTVAIIATDVFSLIKTGWLGLYDLANAVLYNITSDAADSTNQTSGFFAVLFANTAEGFTGLLQGVSRIIALAASTLAGFFKWVGNGLASVAKAIANAFIWGFNQATKAANFAISGISSLINGAFAGLNALIDGANKVLAKTPLNVQLPTITLKANATSGAKQLDYLNVDGKTLGANIAEYVSMTVSAVDGYFQGVASRKNQVEKSKADLSAVTQNFNAMANAAKKAGNAGKKAGDKTGNSAKKAKSQLDELTKAIENANKAAISQIADLKKQLALFADDSPMAQLMYELNQGKFALADSGLKDQLIALRSQLDLLTEQKQVREAYKTLQNNLLSDEAKQTNELQKQLDLIAKAKQQGEAGTGETTQQAIKQFASPFALNPVQAQGALGEVQKIQSEKDRLESEYQAYVEHFEKLKTNKENHLAIMAALDANYRAKKAELDEEQKQAELNLQLERLENAQNLFGNLAGITKTFAGENSKAYRVMFAIEKGFAIARSIIAIQQGIAQAAANPFPLNIAAMASVAASTASIISTIQSVRQPAITGQAHDGIDNISRAGTWYLDGGERIVKPSDNKKLTQFLDKQNTNTNPIHVEIHNYAPVKVATHQDDNGNLIVIITEQINKQVPPLVGGQLANPSSTIGKGLKNNWQTLPRR